MKRIKNLLSKVIFFSSVAILVSCSDNPTSSDSREYVYSYDNYALMMVDALDEKYAYLERSFNVTDGEIQYMEIYHFEKSEDPFYHLQFKMDRMIKTNSLDIWFKSEPKSSSRNVYSIEGNILFQSGSYILMIKKSGISYNMRTDQYDTFIPEPVGINKMVIIDDGVFIGDDKYGGLRYQIGDLEDIKI